MLEKIPSSICGFTLTHKNSQSFQMYKKDNELDGKVNDMRHLP